MSDATATLDILIDVRDRLYDLINDQSKPQDVRIAALGEHDEVALRVRALLARDLAQQVAGLKDLADKVTAAHKEVKLVIASAKKASDIVQGIGKFLGFADKLIDKAKLLLPLL